MFTESLLALVHILPVRCTQDGMFVTAGSDGRSRAALPVTFFDHFLNAHAVCSCSKDGFAGSAEEDHQDWRICFLHRNESFHQRDRHSDGPTRRLTEKKLARGLFLLVMLIGTRLQPHSRLTQFCEELSSCRVHSWKAGPLRFLNFAPFIRSMHAPKNTSSTFNFRCFTIVTPPSKKF